MSASSELNAACYLQALKELLRERGVTYAHLAEALGCSLPTVKRALNKPSLPFSRLLEFCDTAHVSFEELCERAQQHRPQHYVFTAEQDRLFAEREEILRYFLELAVEGRTPADIAGRHDLDRKSTRSYLQHLARVGLVELKGAGQARVLVEPPFGFGPGSRVLRRRHEAFLRTVVTNVLSADSTVAGCVAVLKSLVLTEQDYGQMITDVSRVIDQYAAISERGYGRGVATPWQVALACGPGDDPPPGRLPRIDG